MAGATTASFVCELPLRATPADERELLIRLDNARQVYNACLGASLGRQKQLKELRAYKKALQMARGVRGSEAYEKRKAAFRDADEQVGFREYDLHAYAKQFGQEWVGIDRLDSLTIQKIATRAFRGRAGIPFRREGQTALQRQRLV